MSEHEWGLCFHCPCCQKWTAPPGLVSLYLENQDLSSNKTKLCHLWATKGNLPFCIVTVLGEEVDKIYQA